MGPDTTPQKGREVGSAEPWTPTCNLKMLISAASPDIRNREKELCPDPDELDDPDLTQDSKNEEESKKIVSRKEKSLGLLCHKFLTRFTDCKNMGKNISLDDVSAELNVGRRRIYDIMNVFESLHMVSRSAKNSYTWHGRANLPHTLALLKKVGEEHKYEQQMQQILKGLPSSVVNQEEEKENKEDRDVLEPEQKELFFVELPGVEFKAASVNSRKDKSLRVMSQKFVMLFLVSTSRMISLDLAAKILIGEHQFGDQDRSKVKTKVRRLYDIANVLRSLKLIEKVPVMEEGVKKTGFRWTGPEEFITVKDSPSSSPQNERKPTNPRPQSSLDHCIKNLFPSPGTKRGFTRHPSLIKLAKRIHDDRRKINSAPSSPAKSDSRNTDLPNKMAQLAAICKIELDQSKSSETLSELCTGDNSESTVPSSSEPVLISTGDHQVNRNAQVTPSTPLPGQAPGAVTLIPAHCSPLIPVLMPQQQGRGPYTVYVSSSSLKPNPLARPQPTSLAVRSMTFEDKTGQSPLAAKFMSAVLDSSPGSLKRLRPESSSETSPSKLKRADSNLRQNASPKLCEILQARLKNGHAAALHPSRPSPRVLHLDPEFVNTPRSKAQSSPSLEHTVETFIDKDDKRGTHNRKVALTPVNVPIAPRPPHSETLVPAGYLIPISQQALLSYKELQVTAGESKIPSTPVNIYQTPTAGSRPPVNQEVTPTSRPYQTPSSSAAASPTALQVNGPSPAILNFTMQNLDLISGSSQGVQQTPERANSLSSPLSLQQRGMVFIKPLSPLQLQQSGSPQQVHLISVPQSLMNSPKGMGLPQHSYFHTPVSLSPLATMVAKTRQSATKTAYIPQRKLDVCTEES
ncbi:transcription factor E2F8 isoform X1 [Synchiropus splendidus]|uniref:transcription factor E2F8 isoform X1 n=1 Tax=Synchiropus splendidus TaxID=270530 RepID=UPI00237E7363|nr:transcription factor E2F8 isoform X1 [Synchiropus splendidus]XP_053721700.1 transcription factor E2F8 isoform X1 [Synchiropus splendidus]